MINQITPSVSFHAASDMLVIRLVPAPYEAGGAEDTEDADVVLHYTADNRLAEVEVSHASERVDLAALRRSWVFEEVRDDFDVKTIREGLKMSQPLFAAYLGVSVGTLRGWEQERREPRGPARRLIQLARDRPGLLFEGVGPGVAANDHSYSLAK